MNKSSIFKFFLYNAFGRNELKKLVFRSRQLLFLPFYHTISDSFLPHINKLYTPRNTQLFKQDIDFFITHFTPLSINQLTLPSHTRFLQKPSFHLTFDDGLSEVYNIVAPILMEKGIPASFFINNAFVDNKGLFYRYKISLLLNRIDERTPSSATRKKALSILDKKGIKARDLRSGLISISYSNKEVLESIAFLLDVDFQHYLKTERPYMTTTELQELKNKGFTIGAHSIDHPLYALLNQDEQIRQTQASIEFVQHTFQTKEAFFSFPFSDEKVNRKFFDQIFDPQHPIADLTFGISGLKQDYHPQHLHRFPMESSLSSAEKMVKSEYLYYLAKAWLFKNKIKRSL